MQIKSTFISAIVIGSAGLLGSLPAQAQDRPEREGQRLHGLCDKGDQKACVRFGMLLNENRGRHEEWRKSHPEFFASAGLRNRSTAVSADPGRSGTNLPWCGVPYSSTRECVYQSIGQCEQDMRPLGGDCEPRD
ncbi:MAG: hypothetical protein JOZ94_10390 [Xanthobacteraceae bacterium]|nr:hypothetical protein [Xanthobacteraceae bacterium]MBV9629369.1 hypothetical protein [Xanthobacteraceae bacterium]